MKKFRILPLVFLILVGSLFGHFYPHQVKAKGSVSPQKAVLTQNNLSDPSQKRIEVDLTNQKLYAYEGNNLVYSFSVSSGKWHLTPTGTFHIWIKERFVHMVGGSKALRTYYDLPNVPFVMFFYNDQASKSDGYSLHGTYWHHNFGHPMSHGCLNLSIPSPISSSGRPQPQL